MTSDIKRVDPRRPFIITAEGRKRIILGAVGGISMAGVAQLTCVAAKPKPRRMTQTAQGNFLVFVYSDRGGLAEPARQAIAAAALLAAQRTEIVLLVFGELHDDLAELGVDRAIVLPAYGALRFEPLAELAVLNELIDTFQPIHIFAPDNVLAEGDLARRLAAQRALSAATHVVELNELGVAVLRGGARSYGRRALPQLILLTPDAVDARLPFIGRGECELRYPAMASTQVYRDVGIEDVDLALVALEEADTIVSAGNGMRDLASFEALARALGAAIGASRVAVDDGTFTRDKQVGATGKTVNANLYIAIGISGAVQHLQGIKDCRHVIAINLDASAPIVKRADLSVIADAQGTMRALLAEIKRAKSLAHSSAGKGATL